MNKATRIKALRCANMLIAGDRTITISGALSKACEILKIDTGNLDPMHYFEKDLGFRINKFPEKRSAGKLSDQMDKIALVWNAISGMQ